METSITTTAAREDTERSSTLSFSVVIPTLNEADTIAATLAAVADHDFTEVIVVDGGSRDGTQDIVRLHPGAKLVLAERGRGQQLAAGAEYVTGDIVVFLHADTTLPTAAIDDLRRALDDPSVVGGCFRLKFDAPGQLLQLSAWASRYDTALTSFGDQAMFARRRSLEQAGGVPRQVLFEDVALRRALKKRGRFKKLDSQVTTSARCFQMQGAFMQQLRNALLLCGYLCGLSPDRLARYYPPRKAA